MKKIKELIILYPSFEKGGATENLINFTNISAEKGIKIYLISNITQRDKIKFFNRNIKFYNVKSKITIGSLNRLITSINSIITLFTLLKKINNKNSLIVSFQSHILPIIFSKIFKRKIIIRNSEDILDATKYADYKISALFVYLLKIFFYNFSDGIITNSKGSKFSLKKFLLNKNVKTIYNPYLKKKSNRNKKKRSNILLSVGRLTKQKDFRTLIFAFYKIRDEIINYKLIIIGDGELKNSLIKLTKDLQIEKRVIFLGWRNKLDKYYKKSKLFVLSSLYEGLGNVLIDAINYEVPIVTTNCKSGPSEIINNKKGGYLSTVSDSDELSKKILFALKYYNLSKKKILFAKKNIDRFLISKNSLKYLEYIEKVFYEKK